MMHCLTTDQLILYGFVAGFVGAVVCGLPMLLPRLWRRGP